MGVILIGAIAIVILYEVIYRAVSNAIKDTSKPNDEGYNISKLVRAGVLTEKEGDVVYEILMKQEFNEACNLEYLKYEKMFKAIKDSGYLDEETLMNKLEKLKERKTIINESRWDRLDRFKFKK